MEAFEKMLEGKTDFQDFEQLANDVQQKAERQEIDMYVQAVGNQKYELEELVKNVSNQMDEIKRSIM